MKKLLLVLVAVFAVQLADAQKFNFGITGGFNFAEMDFDNAQNSRLDFATELKSAFNGGIYGEVSILKGKLTLQPQIMYSAEGFISRIDSTGDNSSADAREVETNLNFMSVPVLLKFKPTKFLNIQLGPEFGYLLKAVAKGDVDKNTVTDFYNRAELGLNAGIGLTFKKVIDVNIRYNRGLTDIFDGNASELAGEEPSEGDTQLPQGQVSIANNMFQVSVGLNIAGLLRGNNSDND